jgi:hypothetical protein
MTLTDKIYIILLCVLVILISNSLCSTYKQMYPNLLDGNNPLVRYPFCSQPKILTFTYIIIFIGISIFIYK